MNLSPPQRRWLALATALIVLALAHPHPFGIAAGTMLICLGTVMRNWAVGYQADPEQLGLFGPYSMTQNPLVFANSAIATGLTIASTNPVTVVIGLLIIIGLTRAALRDAGLFRREHFGDAFEKYAAQTPVYMPRVGNLEVVRGGFSWKRVFAQEEWLVWLGVLGMIVVFWWIFFLQTSGRWWI